MIIRKRYTVAKLVEDVLRKEEARTGQKAKLRAWEIWEKAQSWGFDKKLGSNAQNPEGLINWTLDKAIYYDTGDCIFAREGRPRRYFLKETGKPSLVNQSSEKKEADNAEGKKEEDLYPNLKAFVKDPKNWGGKEIEPIRIGHQTSQRRKYQQWLHPDLVGFYFPGHLGLEVKNLVKNNITFATLYSFELKREISQANYRECFFQAVSNSSWANEGYLVVGQIDLDNEALLSELKRLTSSFGIGIINLDVNEKRNSSKPYVLYPAVPKNYIDWETVDKLLSSENKDFKEFIAELKRAIA